jgi:hypothetical protein
MKMSEGEKVVFLAFSNREKIANESVTLLACKRCRNKTYRIVYYGSEDGFPTMECAACGSIAGEIGWVKEDGK